MRESCKICSIFCLKYMNKTIFWTYKAIQELSCIDMTNINKIGKEISFQAIRFSYLSNLNVYQTYLREDILMKFSPSTLFVINKDRDYFFFIVSLLNGAGLSLNLNLGAAITAGTAPVTTQLLEHIKLNLRTTGFSEPAATEILAAIATLAKYNILGMGIGMPSSMSYLGNPMDSTTTANGSNNNGGVFGPIGTVPALGSTSPTPRNTLDRYEPFDPFRQNNTAASAIHLNNNSFGLGTNQLSLVSKSPTQVDANNKETKKVDIEIAEVIVGAILGPGGRALIEIQHLSGANIQISKKGMFAPGTRNRIVTITGYPNAINTAQYLIEQRISEEEAKRARQNAIASMIH